MMNLSKGLSVNGKTTNEPSKLVESYLLACLAYEIKFLVERTKCTLQYNIIKHYSNINNANPVI